MESTNFEEYDDPNLYDRENEKYKMDIPFLLKWAKKTTGPIIDLACGTGRATIPLALEGFELIGVDVYRAMLEKAKQKSKTLPVHIDWVEQDCTKLDLRLSSNFIYSVGNSFQHFLTNEAQDAFLTSVNNHLQTGGIFIFGTRFPSMDELFVSGKEEYWRSDTDDVTKNKIDIYMKSEYDPFTQVQHNITIRKWINKFGEVVDEKRTNIRLRFVFPQEMERILEGNGFEILHVYADWKESPVQQNSNELIYVCKKK
ncbi:class I SAM-dependent methyltransferase [Virgibacillus soli]